MGIVGFVIALVLTLVFRAENDDSVSHLIVAAVLGMFSGAYLGAGLDFLYRTDSNKSVAAYVERTGRQTSLTRKIDVPGSRAWAMCRTVDQITETRAWAAGNIDQHKRLPAILWDAVVIEAEKTELSRLIADAVSHGSLRGLAATNKQRITQLETAAKDAERKLAATLAAAREIDRRDDAAEKARAAEEWRQESRIRRQAEEERLRGLLEQARDATVVDAGGVGSADGLVAETEGIARLLDANKDVLRRPD